MYTCTLQFQILYVPGKPLHMCVWVVLINSLIRYTAAHKLHQAQLWIYDIRKYYRMMCTLWLCTQDQKQCIQQISKPYSSLEDCVSLLHNQLVTCGRKTQQTHDYMLQRIDSNFSNFQQYQPSLRLSLEKRLNVKAAKTDYQWSESRSLHIVMYLFQTGALDLFSGDF